MPKDTVGAYDDELTAEEEKLLNEGMADTTVPPSEDDDENAATVDTAIAEAGVTAPAVVDPAEPAVEPAAVTDDAQMAEFMAKHAGKTPEELLKIAFQQTQRAGKAENVQRRSQDDINTIKRLATERLEAKRAEIAQKRQDFAARLADNPDAAAIELNDRLLSEEEQQAEREEKLTRIDAAIELASSAIPDFKNQYQAIHDFGMELNYTPEEVGAITDGRDLVTLYLASLTGRLIKSGVMDVRGNFRSMPAPVAETDPRLSQQGEAVTTLSSTAGATTAPGNDDTSQLASMLGMSDEDFDKLSDNDMELLLRRVGG